MGKRVLVAEDEPVNQFTALRFLAKLGYAAKGVANGKEALEALQQERFDAVLMDIQMSVMDGIEATMAIRESDAPWSTIPIVAMTAHAMAGDRESFLAAGMDDYIAKPMEVAELSRVLAQLLG